MSSRNVQCYFQKVIFSTNFRPKIKKIIGAVLEKNIKVSIFELILSYFSENSKNVFFFFRKSGYVTFSTYNDVTLCNIKQATQKVDQPKKIMKRLSLEEVEEVGEVEEVEEVEEVFEVEEVEEVLYLHNMWYRTDPET